MKNLRKLLAIVCCLIGLLSASPIVAQDMEQLEKSMKAIELDLHQKSLELSWKITEEYLNVCDTFNKTINISLDDYLKVLTYETKPKELNPQEEAYKIAKEKTDNHLKMNKEYTQLMSKLRSAMTEADRKDITSARSAFYGRLWNEDETYRTLRSKEITALRQYRIATVRYMLNEYKEKKMVMPSTIISYKERNSILENNVDLKRLSQEINQLESMQKKLIQECQRLKYNFPSALSQSKESEREY